MAKADNQEVKTKRQLLNERLQGRYPDIDVNDDEAVFGRISDDYDQYDNDIAGYQEREKAFADMFDKDPRSADFLMNWREGGDPVVALVRNFGTEITDAVNDPERQEELAEANKEFVERVAKSKELEAEYQKNLAESLETIAAMQEEKGLTDEEVDNAMELLAGIYRDALVGKFTRDSIEKALMAIKHDADVAAAAHEAEVRGKNATVEEKLRKPARKGDGMPALGGRNGGGGRVAKPRNLGALDNFGDNNKTIWERGNEKRIPRG